jgi:hypothetical protein
LLSGFNDDSLYSGDTNDDYDLNKMKESIERINRFIQYFKKSLSSFLFNRKKNKNKNISSENIDEIVPTCVSKKFDNKYLKWFHSSKWRKINNIAKNSMEHRYFEYFLVLIIVLSCISLVIKIYFINFI